MRITHLCVWPSAKRGFAEGKGINVARLVKGSRVCSLTGSRGAADRIAERVLAQVGLEGGIGLLGFESMSFVALWAEFILQLLRLYLSFEAYGHPQDGYETHPRPAPDLISVPELETSPQVNLILSFATVHHVCFI